MGIYEIKTDEKLGNDLRATAQIFEDNGHAGASWTNLCIQNMPALLELLREAGKRLQVRADDQEKWFIKKIGQYMKSKDFTDWLQENFQCSLYEDTDEVQRKRDGADT